MKIVSLKHGNASHYYRYFVLNNHPDKYASLNIEVNDSFTDGLVCTFLCVLCISSLCVCVHTHTHTHTNTCTYTRLLICHLHAHLLEHKHEQMHMCTRKLSIHHNSIAKALLNLTRTHKQTNECSQTKVRIEVGCRKMLHANSKFSLFGGSVDCFLKFEVEDEEATAGANREREGISQCHIFHTNTR